jgi:hypothetical protein
VPSHQSRLQELSQHGKEAKPQKSENNLPPVTLALFSIELLVRNSNSSREQRSVERESYELLIAHTFDPSCGLISLSTLGLSRWQQNHRELR